MFVADGDRIDAFVPNAAAPPVATLFGSGLPVANGLAVDTRLRRFEAGLEAWRKAAHDRRGQSRRDASF